MKLPPKLARYIRARLHRKLIAESGLFDAKWYLENYPDVRKAKLDPITHYLVYGAIEGRQPSEYFDASWYLANNPDIADSSINPLVHYLKHGVTEGRLPKQPRGLASLPPRVSTPASSGILSTSTARRVIQKAGALRDSPVVRRASHLRTFVDYPPQSRATPKSTPSRGASLRIAFVIPDFDVGAGGHMTIFRIIHFLEKFGHKVSILIQNPSIHGSPEAVKATINREYQPFSGDISFITDRRLPSIDGDALVATDRFTCYPVQAMAGFQRKFYLVQDYETLFYPAGAESLLTEATYKMGFDCLCAGNWLTALIQKEYGQWARAWPLAYDPSAYFIDERTDRRASSIAFYSRHATARRSVELGLLAFEILTTTGLDFHVDFFGADVGRPKGAYSSASHGVLSAGQLGDLYRSSSIGLVFSATNHSLVNKEMMACGLPVIDLNTQGVRDEFPPGTYLPADATPQGIADALLVLLRDNDRRLQIGDDGRRFVERFSWEESARIVEGAIATRLANA